MNEDGIQCVKPGWCEMLSPAHSNWKALCTFLVGFILAFIFAVHVYESIRDDAVKSGYMLHRGTVYEIIKTGEGCQ